MATGIINANINQDDPLKSVAGYEAEQAQMGAGESVESRIEGIIGKNSPLMQQARTQSLQQMNQRGLTNSSMAVGAGQGAVIGAAAPIASQDASTSAQFKMNNQQATNQARQFTAGSQTQGALQAHQGIIQKELQGMQGEQSLAQIAAQGEQSLAQIAAQGGISKELQEMSQQHQTAMQNLIHLQNLGTIDAQTMSQLRVNQQQIDAQIDRDIRVHEQALEAARLSGDLQAQRDAQLQIYNLESMRAQQHNQIELANINFTHQEALASLGHEHQTQLQEMMNKHQTTLQNSAAAVSLYGTAMQAIAQIGSMEGLTQAQRDAGVNQQFAFLEAGMQLAGADIGDIPLFNGNTGTTTGTGTAATSTATGGTAQATSGSLIDPSIKYPAAFQGQIDALVPGRYNGEKKELVVRLGSRTTKLELVWNGTQWIAP